MGRRTANHGVANDLRQLERGESLIYHHANCTTEASRCSRRASIASQAQRILGAGNYNTYHEDDTIEIEFLLPGQLTT